MCKVRSGEVQGAFAVLGNIVYDALTSRGLVTPPHSTVVGSSIASDDRYHQVAMFPETTRKWLVNIGVFDFDAVVSGTCGSGRDSRCSTSMCGTT